MRFFCSRAVSCAVALLDGHVLKRRASRNEAIAICVRFRHGPWLLFRAGDMDAERG